MNKDIARKIIALVGASKKGSSGLKLQDFIKEINFRKNLLSSEEVEKFVRKAVEEKVLIQNGDEYSPNFSVSGIIVPLDFVVDINELYTDRERPLVDRMLDAVAASGKLKREDAAKKARELNEHMKYMGYEIALLAVLQEEGIDISQFIAEIQQ